MSRLSENGVNVIEARHINHAIRDGEAAQRETGGLRSVSQFCLGAGLDPASTVATAEVRARLLGTDMDRLAQDHSLPTVIAQLLAAAWIDGAVVGVRAHKNLLGETSTEKEPR